MCFKNSKLAFLQANLSAVVQNRVGEVNAKKADDFGQKYINIYFC